VMMFTRQYHYTTEIVGVIKVSKMLRLWYPKVDHEYYFVVQVTMYNYV